MAIDGITELEGRGFEVEEIFSGYAWEDYYSRLGLMWVMNRDVIREERAVLNTFDLLGKVGGVYGLLATISGTLLSIINYQKSENILVSKLYSTTVSGPEK